ncbi:MAG: hypothetical protein V4620_02010 [Bacteroidota bacterium]
MSSHYQILTQKLDAFIRKYYKNQLIKGSIFFFIATISTFILIATLEYFGRYNSTIRACIFFTFLAFTIFGIVKYIVIPLTGILKLRKTINYEQASTIIGKHFSNVNDSLLNTLQLKHTADALKQDNSLLIAAIEQKTALLNPIPFQLAVNFKENLKYAKYAILPIIAIVLLSFVKPDLLSDGSKRILQYDKTFAPIAPFNFTIENTDLNSEQFTDFDLQIKVSGKQIPSEVFINVDGNLYKLQQKDKTHFLYGFKNVQKSTLFTLQADEFNSQAYTLNVVAKPIILGYQVKCVYPGYLGKKEEVINNPTDFSVPAGTNLTWNFTSKQTTKIELGFDNKTVEASASDESHFSFHKKVFVSQNYFIKNSNLTKAKGDSMYYALTVIPDALPIINVEEKRDSVTGKQVYFIGDGNDDYGLTKLTFNYRFVNSDDKAKLNKTSTRLIAIDRKQNPIRFNYYIDLNETNIESGDELEYYFEIWDNDGVFGAKSAKSKTMLFKAASQQELKEQSSKNAEATQSKMEEALKEAKELQQELKLLQQKMQEKRELTWEEKRKAESILKQQQELNKKIEQLNKEFKLNNQREQEYKKEAESILEKQQQIEKMYNELMNDEMKQLMKKVEDMMKQQNKNQLKQEMENLQLNNKDVEKELDKMLEMYKELELEKKLNNATKDLENLAQKQEDLQQKTEQKTASSEELKKEQDKLNKEFDELKKDLKDIEKQNESLEDKKELTDTKEEEKSIEEEMKKSSDDLSGGKESQAQKKQKKAAEKMKEMAEKMKKNKEEQEAKEAEIDVQTLREVIENLVELSKQQEGLMQKFKEVNGYNPQFVQMGQEQKNLKDNAKIIEDSLDALSKRVPEISSFINKEMTKMNSHMNKANQGFTVRNIPQIRVDQQTAMTHMNNLAVMLSDVLKQMQNDLQSSGEGKGKKSGKPQKGKGEGKGQGKGSGKGKGNKSMSQLKKMQEELNKQLREGQNNNGSGKNGDKPGSTGSEQFARMAAQQMAIRQQLQKMLSQMDAKEKEGLGGAGKLQQLQKQMEQTERELFNKRLSQETINRQEEILTRMLESEKAEKKQEQDKKREAEQSKEKEKTAPPPIFDKYLDEKNKQIEILKTVPTELKPYYKDKANEYLKKAG